MKIRSIRFALLALAVLALASFAAGQAQIQVPDAQQIVGPPHGTPVTGEPLEQKTKEVASRLRCPTCQGLSVWDSPASMAINMKGQVRDLVARGYDQEQILLYFERSYGEFVRLEPKLEGINWLVWLAPVIILLAGAVVIRASLKKLRGASLAPATEPDEAAGAHGRDELPEDESLIPYVLRARELAYGWPGGVSPAARSSEPSERN